MRVTVAFALTCIALLGCDQAAVPDSSVQFRQKFFDRMMNCDTLANPTMPSTRDYGQSLHASERSVVWEPQQILLVTL